MSDRLTMNEASALADAVATPGGRFLSDRLLRLLSSRAAIPFELCLPDGTSRRFGQGAPGFRAVLKNKRAVRAVASLDEGRIGDAYLAGDIDLDVKGDLLPLFEVSRSLKDFHPLTAAWRFVQPLLVGQRRTNRSAIKSHYDIDPQFFLSFLDPKTPCYTQGMYESADETLEAATLRKFAYCYDGLKLKPGDHILEIGPGWGAWFEYASARGIKCTGISISPVSIDYLTARAKKLGHDWELIYSDFLNYETEQKYDAIVIMGVIEHLPQYGRVVRKFESLLKPGGRVFLDGSACTKKYELSSFMVKHIYQANHSLLVLDDFLRELSKTALRVIELYNDRYSYFLTFYQWARNFDANREFVVDRFGQFNYRRFQMYLWGAAYEFLERKKDCYRMILQCPGENTPL
jgi:cyclopropane-fatty-acyl-phospholipid synthase